MNETKTIELAFPRTAWTTERVSSGPGEWSRYAVKLILWSEHDGWCLVSKPGASEPKVVSRNVIHDEKPEY